MSVDYSEEFRKSLREEILHHKDKRASFVLQKLAFTVGLLGVGAIQTEFMGLEPTRALSLPKLGWLLYALPVVALAYDVYIYAEDYKVKRIGTFFRTHYKDASSYEKPWEDYVNKHREPAAVVAGLIVTLITTLPALLLEMSEIGIFTVWWPSVVFVLVCSGMAAFVFWFYRRLVGQLEDNKLSGETDQSQDAAPVDSGLLNLREDKSSESEAKKLAEHR